MDLHSELMTDLDHAYEGARRGALVVRHVTPGVLLASGEDRLDLLHRMSTNAVADLQLRGARHTVLTNALGRIVDLITLVHAEPQSLLITSPDQADDVLDWLQGFIFFNDDVQLQPLREPLSFWGVYGPEAADEISRLMDPREPLRLGAEADYRAGWKVERPLTGWHLLLGPVATRTAEELWSAQAESEPVRQAYVALRIEAGLPLFDQDFSQDMTPLEAGLEFALSSTKGCYIGQEVIARMESRGQVPRRLWGVMLSGRAEPGSDLYVDGRSVGTLTSTARSPRLGWIGLARVESRNLPDDRRFTVAEGSMAGELVPLPFEGTQPSAPETGSPS